ncbi:MAG: glycosyltransferase family 4 protein [Acetobacter sp.]|nr:glycosyltransferase family 4 protein [Acetobacter sp.]
MRIACIIDGIYIGGSERLNVRVSSFLQKAGHDVVVFSIFAPSERNERCTSWWKEAGIRLFVRPRTPFINHRHRMFWLSQHFKKWKPDLIWTSPYHPAILGQTLGHKLNIPVVSWNFGAMFFHDSFVYNDDRTCLWVGDCRAATDTLARYLPAERFANWPPNLFNEGTFQLAQPWSPNTPLRLGSVGRLAFQKGYDVLIKALSLLDADTLSIPFHITIVGDGSEREKLEALVMRRNLQKYVTFAGAMLDPRSFLSSLHLYLQPSRYEGFCNAAHEAMQVGLPVIASDVGELKYSVQNDQTGWFVSPDDPIALRDALKFALHNPHLLAPMGQNARHYVSENFSSEKFVQNGSTVLQKIHDLTGLK